MSCNKDDVQGMTHPKEPVDYSAAACSASLAVQALHLSTSAVVANRLCSAKFADVVVAAPFFVLSAFYRHIQERDTHRQTNTR